MQRTAKGKHGHRRQSRRAAHTQREVICDVMLSAARCGTWLTLRELGRLTRYGEASISAQLRHLRKPRYGAFLVAKRRRENEGGACLARHTPPWEYRLAPSRGEGLGRQRRTRGGQ